MKRSYEEDDEEDYVYSNAEVDAANTSQVEKRSRSGSPPRIIGPFVFNDEGSSLQKAMYQVNPSQLPGVHRMIASPSSQVRLWSPQWPQTQFLEPSLAALLESVNGKIVFVFDTRSSEQEPLLGSPNAFDLLAAFPLVIQQGALVSKFAPPSLSQASNLPMAYIQDPAGDLAKLCKFSEYLGPSAVCVNNSEVVALVMLARSLDQLHETFQRWASI